MNRVGSTTASGTPALRDEQRRLREVNNLRAEGTKHRRLYPPVTHPAGRPNLPVMYQGGGTRLQPAYLVGNGLHDAHEPRFRPLWSGCFFLLPLRLPFCSRRSFIVSSAPASGSFKAELARKLSCCTSVIVPIPSNVERLCLYAGDSWTGSDTDSVPLVITALIVILS